MLLRIILCGVTVKQFHHLIFHNAPISRILTGLANAFTPMPKRASIRFYILPRYQGLYFLFLKNGEF